MTTSTTDAATRLSAGRYFFWLAVFVCIKVFRQKFLLSIDQSGWSFETIASTVTALDVMCWYFIYQMAGDPRIQTANLEITSLEAGLVLAYVCYFLVLADPREYISIIPFVTYIAVRFVPLSEFRAVALAIVAISILPLLSAAHFSHLHATMAKIDAVAVSTIFDALGHEIIRNGTILSNKAAGHALEILPACASTYGLGTVASGFIVLVCAWRGTFRAMDLMWLAAVVASATIVNWSRLSLMAISNDYYRFWHAGEGAAVVSALDMVIVLMGSYFATRAHLPKENAI